MISVKRSLIFLLIPVWIISGCNRGISLVPNKIRGVFVSPPEGENAEIDHLTLQSIKRNWGSQLAFQSDQLNTQYRPPISAVSDIEVPDFTPEALDEATNLLLVVPPQPNPYAFDEADLVDYPDAVYQQRFRKISTDVPLEFNHQVKNYIEVYALRKRDLTQRMLGRSEIYYPYIEQVLTENDLPDELKHLVMVESALETVASSNRSAVGLWQIRPITGRGLGLEINNTVDERLDPYASTHAAVKYLKRLREMYGDWLMAIAAYNCGPGNMHKAIVRAGGSKNFWRVQRFLPRETRNYVPAFMAIVYLNFFQEEHNLRPQYPDLSFREVDTVRIYEEIALEKVASTTAVTLDELKFLNPALIRNKIPFRKDGYLLVLPLDKIARFEKKRHYLVTPTDYAGQIARTARITKQKQAVVPNSPHLTKLAYRVRSGNTMISIARRYGCSVKDIQDWNAKPDHVIRVGEELTLYVAKTQTSP